jgi:hypothetical protein
MAANRMTYDTEIGWNVDELGGIKEKGASYGIDLEMVALPLNVLSDDGE